MAIISGNYITESTTTEIGFSLYIEGLHVIPPNWLEQLEEFGAEAKDLEINIPRTKIAEAILAVMSWEVESTDQLKCWFNLTQWVQQLAELGCFYPGMIQREEDYLPKWLVDYGPTKIREDLQGWISIFESTLDSNEWREIVPAFVSDCMDSYVRFVINTRFSLNSGSELGKFLRYKPFYTHEEWFNRLCSEEPIPGIGKRWEELYTGLNQWIQKKEDQNLRFGHLGFRLRAEEEGSWYLEFVWQDVDGKLKNWGELGTSKLRDLFLKQLAEASEDYEILSERWEHAPYYCLISMQEAYVFLQQIAPKLRLKGYSVWAATSLVQPKRASFGIEVNLHSKDEYNWSSIPLESLLDFDFRLVLGNQNISLEQLENIYEQNKPFIKWNGEWVLLDPDRLKKAADWVRRQKKKGKMTLKDALFLHALGEDDEFSPFPITAFETEGWVDQWIKLAEGNEEFGLLDAPGLFHGQLRPYQQTGMSWLLHLRKWGMGACLSDDMGLGKTVQFLAYLAYGKENGWLNGPFLLICPTSVLGNWQKEMERFVPDLSFYTHHGLARYNQEAFLEEVNKVDLVMTTYSIIQRDFPLIRQIGWDGIVLDEAQHIKNSSTIQAKAIRTIPSHHRIALTGTPVENRLEELWSIFEFLNEGYLGSRQSFRREFVAPIEKMQNSDRLGSLKKLIRPFFLRRSKSDPAVINDLPEKIEKKEYCYLSEEQAVLYQQVVQSLLNRESKLLGMERKGMILAAISQLKQICDHPGLLLAEQMKTGNSGKLTRVQEMIQEMMDEGDSILIFTQFRKMGEILKQVFHAKWGVDIPFLHGGVRKEERDLMVDRFQSKQGPPIFLLSLKAGGVGLNLTQANRVIHFDRWWNPAVENQATDRAYRIGQKQTVHVHKLICTGTIEEKIDLMMERKQQLVSEIIHTGENWVTELSSSELRDLVALRNELVE